METPSHSELHALLRQATKKPHHELDHHPLLTPLLKAHLDIIEYGNALAALHGIYSMAEAWILEFLEQHPGLFDYGSRLKLPALDADLAILGRLPVPASQDFVAPPRVGALIGVLYTLEGSTQGGQFIARSLRQHGPQDLPIRFFSGYGEMSQQRWNEFLEFADTQCPEDDYGVATATAVSLFGAIKTQLDHAHRQYATCPASELPAQSM